MDKVKNVPEIRFKGFQDEWKEVELNEYVIKAVDNRGKTPLISQNGRYPLIEVISLGSSKPDYSKCTKYLNEDTFKNSLRGYVQEEDILFSTVGRIGLVSLMDDNKKAAIAQNIVAFRTLKNYNPSFVFAMFSTYDNKMRTSKIVMSAVQPSIKVSQLIHVKYFITTNIEEQTKIGNLLKNIDKKLELEKENHEKLTNFKKAMLEEVFPKEGENVPKVRFDGFDDEWGFEAIKNLFYKKSAKSKAERTIDNGKFLIMDMGSVSETGNNISYKRTNCTEDIIDEEGLIMPKDDIGGGKIIGRTAYVDQDNKYVLSDHVYLLYKLTENIIPLFAHYQINSSNFNKKIKRITTGSAQLGISWTNVGEEQLRTPSPEEQVLIGNFFKNLDEKIELSEKKITKIENFKKAMLEKMFV